jgi:hypothetical protein
MSFIDELFYLIWSSGIIQAIAGEANANEGLLALVGLTITVIIFIGRVKWLKVPAATFAIGTLLVTYIFLSPRDGEFATVAELKGTAEASQVNNIIARADSQTNQLAPRSTPTYMVTGVDCDDVLNVRSEPALFSDGAIVGQLSCTESHIVALGNTRRIGFSEWWEIETPSTFGWVNARFLLPSQVQTSHTTSTNCVAIQNPALAKDHTYSQCLVMHLSEGRRAESTWTGACDQQNRAHGLGISRTYTEVDGERRLTAVFFGQIIHGVEFSGTLSRGGTIQPVCSQPSGLTEAFESNTRTTARRYGLHGIDLGLAVMRQQRDENAVRFYTSFRERLQSIR